MNNQGYIHTFSIKEQDRLLKQGQFLEPYIHKNVDFTNCHHLLEIGCGVGAQISTLARNFPGFLIDGIDLMGSQINRANIVLKDLIASGRVRLIIASAYQLPFPENYYDGVCIFSVLEHINDPLAILNEAHRVLKHGGVLYCTEVFNSGLYVYPNCPAISEYWSAFNRYQIDMGGDPDIGIKLANLALETRFKHIDFYDVSPILDGRMASKSKRMEFLDFWKSLFLSASESLVTEGRITSAVVSKLDQEFNGLIDDRTAVFMYQGKQIKCYK
jgi:ubiquinone/menaquinone biosynthesis C-methylase UbiE